ncbi:MAG: hypothetical protein WKF92_04700 [Pyrinomonadaceae bacterium]
MKYLSEKRALEKLQKINLDYRETVNRKYEHKAKSCLTCDTKGACCLDAHFVNVHITRLESAAIRNTLTMLPEVKREEVYARIENSIKEYNLTDSGDTFAKTYACPLFEAESGCIVHFEGKPLPCISHACYENKADLPPDHLQTEQEIAVNDLNRKTYGADARLLPLPVALLRD